MDHIHILDAIRRFGLDFDDTLNYYIVKKYKLEGIVSFNKHFDKTDIRRLEPSEILGRPGTR